MLANYVTFGQLWTWLKWHRRDILYPSYFQFKFHTSLAAPKLTTRATRQSLWRLGTLSDTPIPPLCQVYDWGNLNDPISNCPIRNHSIFFRRALFCLGLDLGDGKPPNFADVICDQPLIRNRPALGSIVRSRKDPSMTKYQICPLDRWHIRVCSCAWPCCGWGTNKHSCSTWLCSHLLVIQTLSLKTARVYTNRNSSKNRARWKSWGAV